MIPENIDEQSFSFLKRKITQLGIFNCENYNDSFLSRRVECRMRALNISSFLEYCTMLERDFEERDKLFKEFTIHVTHFFRDSSMYDAIKNEVIPNLLRNKEGKNDYKIKVWCAGCSSGEEIYSIAILLKEGLGPRFEKFSIEILGTDIDSNSIERAEKGFYEQQQLKETDSRYIEGYFDKVGSLYKIKDEIKRMVHFQIGDILSLSKPKSADIVVCRNTVIYFNFETKSKFYVDVYRLLNNSGFFILGKTETLLGPAREMFDSFNDRERIFIKNEKT